MTLKKKRIGIFGAGNFGQYVYDVMKHHSNKEIICFLDNNAGNILREIPVWSVSELKVHMLEIDQIWLAVKNFYQMGDIVLQLHDIGVKEIWIIKPDLWNKRMLEQSIFEIENRYMYYLDISKKAVITKLEFDVCNVCNLNCRGCGHFAPIFKGEYVRVEDFQKQMDLLSRRFANVFRFRLMGGEPFLHKEFDKFIKIAREKLPYTHLEIVTNGLLLKNVPDYIWQAIIENEAVLNISLYPPTFRIKDEIVAMLGEKGIEYSFGSGLEQYNEDGIIEEFHKCFTENKTHNPIIAFRHCMFKSCHYLRDGKISKCSYPLLSYSINDYYQKKYIVEEADYVDLEDTKILPWDMVRRLRAATPFCAYCIEDAPVRFSWQTGGDYRFEDYIIEEGEEK
ncbi:MAG: radical SAM protein [Lachnospiraceae bacterium]|nr:radical SAM protein [Lachnospiraceae bacterium]